MDRHHDPHGRRSRFPRFFEEGEPPGFVLSRLPRRPDQGRQEPDGLYESAVAVAGRCLSSVLAQRAQRESEDLVGSQVLLSTGASAEVMGQPAAAVP